MKPSVRPPNNELSESEAILLAQQATGSIRGSLSAAQPEGVRTMFANVRGIGARQRT